MTNFKQYAIYLLLVIASAAGGAAVSHFYSSKIINSLQEEIDNDRKKSLEAIKDHQAEIYNLESLSQKTSGLNTDLQKQIERERQKRKSIKIDSSKIAIISNNTDTILNYFRNKLK